MSEGDVQVVQINVRLWPGQDDDLIAWYESLDNLPRGGKAQRIRNTLRQAIGAEDDLEQTVKAAVEKALAARKTGAGDES
jgi:hypothetical protein